HTRRGLAIGLKCRRAKPYHLPRGDVAACRNDATEPTRPGRAGEPAERGKQRPRRSGIGADQILSFMDDRFVETGTSATGLIDDIRRYAMAYRVVHPALGPGCGSFDARSRIARSMDHDQRPALGPERNLKMYVHAANDDLRVRARR